MLKLLMRIVFASAAAFALTSVDVREAWSQMGSGLPLPPGQVIVGPVYRGPPSCPNPLCYGTSVPSITAGDDANLYLSLKYTTPPYTPGTPAAVVQTTAPTQYVRFFLPGGAVGGFIVGSNEVRGLTPTQIQNVLALSYTPTMETLVQVPAGTCLLVGSVNPNYGQQGGAIQEFLVGKSQGGPGCGPVPQYIDASSFINQQPIGAYALFYEPRAGGGNAGAVAAALDHGPYPALFTPMDGMYNSFDVLNYGDPAPLRAALTQLDGEVYASAQTVILADSLYLREALLDRMRQSSFMGAPGPTTALSAGGPVLAYADKSDAQPASDAALAFADGQRPAFPIKAPPAAAPTPETVFWAQVLGAWGRFEGTGNASDVSRNLAGFLAGVDRRIGPNWLVGLAGGYTNSYLSIGDPASSANIDTAHLAGYMAANFGPWNLRGAAAGSFSMVGTSRSISFPGFADSASASYDATIAQVFGEAGYGVALGQIATEPFVGLAFVHLNTNAFSESGGSSAAALSGSSSTDDIGYSTLGARAATNWSLAQGMVLTPHASAAWQHAFGPVAPAAALAFESNGAPFTVTGVPLARDAALVDVGLDLHVTAQVTLAVLYFGDLAGNVQDNSVQGSLRWRF